MFKKVLIANRGEIAVRIIRACREMGIATVAIYSKADSKSLHVQLADESICVGDSSNTDSYLNLANVLMAAQISGADAVHPGYGYFSERSSFADALASLGIKFVGPSVEAMHLMGDKARSKEVAIRSDCPVIPGTGGVIYSETDALKAADKIGYPALLKAVAGGGGKGIRKVENPDDLSRLWPIATSEAQASFGSPDMMVEKYIEEPRHVEVQIIADEHGNVIHLGERECSIQNLRHQKIIEESPCAVLKPETRAEMGAAAVRVAKAVGYTNAGTVEFLLDKEGKFYFLEMNTRIQVEHPVTEEVVDKDLIKLQLLVAAGEPIPFKQEDVVLRGHAIEARITAQDLNRGFEASTGVVTAWQPPSSRGIRLESHIFVGYEVTPFYDPLIAKLIVRGENRQEAVRKLQVALDTFVIGGVKTNIDFLKELANHPDFVEGDVNTGFVPRFFGGNVG